MLDLIAVFLIFFGGSVFWLAFKPGSKKIGPILLGSLLIAAGLAILPKDRHGEPDVHYRR